MGRKPVWSPSMIPWEEAPKPVEDAPKIELVSAKEPPRRRRRNEPVGQAVRINLTRPKQTRTITLEVSADVHAFLADCATANGGEPEDIAASMLAELVRDTEASEAA